VKIWDFDFSTFGDKLPNDKCKQKWANDSNVDEKANQTTDLFYFIH